MKFQSPAFAIAATLMSALLRISKSARHNITALATSGIGILSICYAPSRVTELFGAGIPFLAVRLGICYQFCSYRVQLRIAQRLPEVRLT